MWSAPLAATQAYLSFRLFHDDVGNSSMTVAAGGTSLVPECTPGGEGFATCSASVSANLGSNFDVTFTYQAATGTSEDGLGAYLDDVRVDWQCSVGGE